MIARRTILIGFMALAIPAWAGDKAAPRLGIKGYDPVSYFTQGRPVKGAPSLHADFDGTRYLFASEANRDAFAANPARYEPQFGGLCATGIAFGKKAESDPTQWAILDGKLYVFSSLEAKEMAVKDRALLERAHRGAK
jgi:YHS domain-containing protein